MMPSAGRFKDVPAFGDGSHCSLVWSSKEDTLYLKSGNEYWEISLASQIDYTRLSKAPTDFADDYGRVGTTWSREVLVELGDYVYLTDITTKRIGPVMQGEVHRFHGGVLQTS